MLQHTFCHIHGIGVKTEARLWDSGIMSWADWHKSSGIALSQRALMEIPQIFEDSQNALENHDPRFFCDRLTSSDQWRIFADFRDSTAYLDIETTGLGEDSDITTISLYDGNEVFYYVNGRNLDDFVNDIDRYTVLVSYNGKSFDIPIIENFFRIRLDHAQIDLRYVLARLGFKGGLKGCEKMLGINRGALDGVDGSFAVYLWHRYERYNDEKALETLLAYNIEDTVNLERLLVEAWNRNIIQTPFADKLALPYPQEPALIFHPDIEIVESIRNQHFR